MNKQKKKHPQILENLSDCGFYICHEKKNNKLTIYFEKKMCFLCSLEDDY